MKGLLCLFIATIFVMLVFLMYHPVPIQITWVENTIRPDGMLYVSPYYPWTHKKSWFINPLYRMFRVNCMCDKTIFGSMHTDGYKVACKQLISHDRKCVVYSLGSFGNFDFEQSVHKDFPFCTIHTFDKDYYEPPSFVKFSTQFIGSKPGRTTLKQIKHTLRHTNITLLKVDIESGEWEILEQIFDDSVDQVEIEVHHITPQRLQQLADAVDTHFCLADVNPNVACYNCLELLFINKRLLPQYK